MESGTPFTAKDAKELAGLSYRQLNDWDARGAVPAERDKEGGWRKFTPKQLFSLMICNEIRRLYGIPVERLGFVSSFMTQEGPNHLAAAIELMAAGLHVFLLTDLEETFVMDSDLTFMDYMRVGYFRVEETRPYIFLRLNEIVNRLLGAMKDAAHLEPRDDLYRARRQVGAAISVRTAPELDLLQAIRSGKFDRVEVKVKEGRIRFLNAEGEVEADELAVDNGSVNVTRKAEFETLSITTRDGQVVTARRTLPKKYSDEDNKPARLFVDKIWTQAGPPERSRDGKQPSDVPQAKTRTRRDRKTLSREDHGAPPGRTRAPHAQSRKVPKDSR